MMDRCPHCGSEEGYVEYCYATGVVPRNTDFPGTVRKCNHKGIIQDIQYNEHMYDNLRYKQNKYATCQTCDKKIAMDDILNDELKE